MIKQLVILSVSFLIFSSFTFNTSKVEKKRTKKLEKALVKVWDKPVELVPIQLPLHDHGLNKFEAVVVDTDTLGLVFSGRVFSCRAGGCDIKTHQEETIDSEGEYFDLFVIFNNDYEVRKVEVYSYKATHGQAVTAKSWLKQFINYNGGDLRYGKDIDALSGATISAENLTFEVQRVTNFLHDGTSH